MLIGGLLANVLALTAGLPRPLLLPLVIAASIVGGMVWAAVPGFLKARFNVNEVVSCIMMNWVAYWVVYIVISDHFKSTTIDTESQVIPAAASLKTEAITLLTKGSNLNLGIFIAIIATALVIFILNRTVLGYEMKAVGFNRFAAEYGGINVQKNAVLAMVISGALPGWRGSPSTAATSPTCASASCPPRALTASRSRCWPTARRWESSLPRSSSRSSRRARGS